MIVIAIIGILAAVAVPQYQDYISRAQLSRVYGEISSLKTAVEENVMRGDSATTVADLGWTGSNLVSTTPTVAIAAATGVSKLTATLDGDVSPGVRGAVVTLDRKADGKWECSISNGTNAGAWKASFKPKGCA